MIVVINNFNFILFENTFRNFTIKIYI